MSRRAGRRGAAHGRTCREGIQLRRPPPVRPVVVVSLPLASGSARRSSRSRPSSAPRCSTPESAGFGLLMTAFGSGAAASALVVTLFRARIVEPDVVHGWAVRGRRRAVRERDRGEPAARARRDRPDRSLRGLSYSAGFSLVQEATPDELRGRVFGVLNQAVRLALFLAFTLWPLASTGLDDVVGGRQLDVFGFSYTLVGTRVTLWLAGRAHRPRRCRSHRIPGGEVIGSHARTRSRPNLSVVKAVGDEHRDLLSDGGADQRADAGGDTHRDTATHEHAQRRTQPGAPPIQLPSHPSVARSASPTAAIRGMRAPEGATSIVTNGRTRRRRGS